MTIRQEMGKLFSCNLPAITSDNLKKLDIDENQKTEIERRFNLLQAQLKVSQVGGNPRVKMRQQEIATINNQNMIRVGESIRSVAFKQSNAQGLQGFLARDMAIVHDWMGMGRDFTNAGWVRESMNRIRRLWRGGINDMIRRYGMIEYTRKTYAPLVDMLKKKGLRQDQIDRILTDAIEKSMYPIMRNSQNLGQRGLELLDQKYRNFIDSLYNVYHLTDPEVKSLVDAGEGMAQVYHRLATAAQDAGINVNETEVWGYFNRILSTDAERRYTWKWEDENHIRWNDNSATPVTESLLKSRTTSQYIVEDEVLLDYVLRSIGEQDGQDPTYYYKLVTGEPDGGIGDVLDSNYGLSKVVGAILERNHPEVVESLIDSGLLSKVPFSTVEIFEHMRQTLDFPFENLREVFAVDWNVGLRTYREQLGKVAEESGFVNLVLKEAIEGNWGVNTLKRTQNPSLYSGWVPLREVIHPRILNKSFQSYNPLLGDLYIHPTVAALAKAQQELVLSPSGLSSFGRIIRSINTRFKQLALASLEYIPRQVWQNLIAVGAAGGNILTMPIAASKFFMYNAFAHSNPELAGRLFNNTAKRYRLADGTLLTELELVRHLEDVGILSRFEPLTGRELNPASYSPNGVKRQARYLIHTLRNEGVPRTLEEATEFSGGLLDRVTYFLAYTNNLLNNIGVFNTIESTTRYVGDTSPLRQGIHRAGTLTSASLKSYETVDEAIENARQFFFFYDDMTYYDRTISNYVIPFWGFLSKNIPNVVRYAARHPNRFMAWQRVYALANAPVQDDEWMNEGSVDEWMLHSNPIWFKIPGGRPDGRDEYFASPLESIDPLNSALNWIGAPAQAVAEHFGIWTEHTVRTTRTRVGEHPWMSTGTNKALQGLMEQTYPLWKGIAAEVSGEDLRGVPLDEGATVDSFLGVRMSPRLEMWLTTLAPVLRTIDTVNPNDMFGTPAQYDVNTGQWMQGQPSWAGVPRTSRDNFGTNNRYEMLRYLGIKIYPVDVYMNAGLTYDTLTVDIIEGRKAVAKMKENAMLLPEGRLKQERLAEIAEYEYIIEQSREDLRRFGDFMRREGLNPRQAYDRMRVRNTRIGDLPDVDNTTQQSQPIPGWQSGQEQEQP